MESAASKRKVIAWAFYDFANSAFGTLALTFVYSAYFTKAIAENETIGTSQWSRAVTLSAIVIAIVSPFLGCLADRRNLRAPLLLAFTLIAILSTAGLYYPLPGEVFLALAIFFVANTAYELGIVFYNAYLPDLATEETIGRISGWAWGLGYIGGVACTVIALVGFIDAEPPWFGFGTEAGENIRATNLLVAVWFALFATPLFLSVRGATTSASNAPTAPGPTFRATLRELRRYPQMGRFLLARLIYNDGLVTIFAFGGIYAAGTFDFSFREIMVFGIAANISAGLGAFAMGYVDDRWGGKRTILATIALFIVATAFVSITPHKIGFWIGGLAISAFAGPNQSASRSLMGRFIPKEKANEFYGFFAFSGKITAFLGPLLLGELTRIFDSQRIGVASVALFFIIGGLLLLRVDERKGITESSPP
ncbi:MAG: MFS transporter [Gemmatimonadetes bacterium]|nr:MFS transporter [Gemmatimonadota bacterium]|tara:strand:+ start:6879 stop:8147 length:1269 start_codon:yes stop_codon:yes gene_type:complete